MNQDITITATGHARRRAYENLDKAGLNFPSVVDFSLGKE
jgi:hypothetical protein